MKRYVHVNFRVEKALSEFKKCEKSAPAFAARKAEMIIGELVGGAKAVHAGRLNKNGETRIKNCVKYNLGQGYRMVCMVKKNNTFVLYVGKHDSCSTWIDKNRNVNHENFFNNKKIPVKPAIEENCFLKNRSDLWGVDDDIQMANISQTDLRKIFEGLVNRC